jgi:D-hexose-6-phosphate mutarotase
MTTIVTKHNVIEGINSQPKLELFLLNNNKSIISSCEIYLWGGTVTSWKKENKENIFLSDKALFNGVKAIRGGIPLVFPAFGQPSHIPLPSQTNPSITSLEKNPMAQHG